LAILLSLNKDNHVRTLYLLLFIREHFMRSRPQILLSGMMAGVLCLAMQVVPAFSAPQKSVVSARTFIGSFSTAPKTEMVASNSQRNFVVSASKAAEVLNVASEITLTDFPVGIGTDGAIELKRSLPIVDGQTTFTVNGTEPYTPPSIQTFRGKVQGDEKSKVVLTIIDGNITGIVQRGDGNRYILSPSTNSKKESREHLLFNETAVQLLPSEREFHCLTSDDLVEEHGVHPTSKSVSRDRTLSNDLLVVDVFIETDIKLYNKLNPNPETASIENVINYAVPLLAMVSSIYEEEINVTFHIVDFNVWDVEDPYQAGGDIKKMLDKFAEYWSRNNGGVRRTIAHLMTGPGSTQVGGIAYRDALCNRGRYGAYSVSGLKATYTYPTLNYTWDVNVIAHEIGHNFASPHTHVCGFWGSAPLDSCVTTTKGPYYAEDACEKSGPAKPALGSIMSYCHLINDTVPLTFTAPVVRVIREGAERAACVKVPEAPTVLMQAPLGNQVLRANAPFEIHWTSWNVSMVGLQYSNNKGQSWHSIVDAVPATNRTYLWTTPVDPSKEMLVRIYSTSDQNVADTSMAIFETSAPALAVAYPAGGERVAQKRKITLLWSKSLVNTVAIDFRPNSGAEWQTQQTGLTGTNYEWTTPEVTTSEAAIRVRDESNNQIIAESQPFTIGAATITIVDPAPGVEWLVNSKQTIRWTSDFVERLSLRYSIDEGATWTRIGSAVPFDAATGSYQWTVPVVESKKVILCAVNRTPNMEEFEVCNQYFTITSVVSVGEETPVSVADLSFVPQPANEQVTIQYTLQTPSRSVQISVADVTGRIVAGLQPENLTAGTHKIEFATSAFAQGVYFVTINVDGTTITKPLTIMH
jgi:hypothetical protein